MKAFYLLLLGCIGSALADEAGDHCMWGASYWCSSIRAAKACGAVQFCIRNTWKDQVFIQGIHDDPTCTFCQKMVTDIRDFVTNDQTEKAIVAFADQACAKLSDKFIADECKGIVNMYIVQIIQMLREKVEPTAVCRSINLCANADLFLMPENYRPYLAVSQTVLTKLAVEKLQSAKVPDVFTTLASSTARQGISQTSSNLHPFIGSADDQCEVCKEGVRDLKKVFSDANVRSEVTQILKSNICPRFVLPAECDKLIDDYAPEIFQTIVNLDPLAACDTIGLCKIARQEEANNDNNMPMADILPAIKIEPAVPVDRVRATTECVLCEYILSTVMSALENNKTEAEVIKAVTNVCRVLPSTVRTECQQFVSQYGQELIDLITHSADPQTICTVIGLCHGNAVEQSAGEKPEEVMLGDGLQQFMNVGPVLNGFDGNSYKETVSLLSKSEEKCFMCRIVANYVVSILNENTTAEAVQAGLDRVCHFLPAEFGVECQKFVDEHTTELLQILMSELNTQTICEKIHLCEKPAAVDAAPNNDGRLEDLLVAPFAY